MQCAMTPHAHMQAVALQGRMHSLSELMAPHGATANLRRKLLAGFACALHDHAWSFYIKGRGIRAYSQSTAAIRRCHLSTLSMEVSVLIIKRIRLNGDAFGVEDHL